MRSIIVLATAITCAGLSFGANLAQANTINASLKLEVNESDGDAKVIVSCSSREPISRVKLWAPDGRVLVDLAGTPRIPETSYLELEGDDSSIDAVRDEYPEGVYFFHVYLDGQTLFYDVELSHEVLAAPAFEPGDESVLDPENATIEWSPVVGATGYSVEVEQGSRRLTWQLDSGQHAVTLPNGYFERGVRCEIDIATFCANGNACLTESTFYLAPERGELVPDLDFEHAGETSFYPLTPGLSRTFEDSDGNKLNVTVLFETRFEQGVLTRVVEERYWQQAELRSITRRYMAISSEARELYCFGQDVDYVSQGVIVEQVLHDTVAPWIALPDGTTSPKKGWTSRVPARVVIVDHLLSLEIGGTVFSDILVVSEPSVIDPSEQVLNFYSAGVGLVKRDRLDSTVVGFIIDDDDDDDDEEDDDGDDDD